jgi:hypothetical protein
MVSDLFFAVSFIMCLVELGSPFSFASTIGSNGIIGPIPPGGFFPTFSIQNFFSALRDPALIPLPFTILVGVVLRLLTNNEKISRLQRLLGKMRIPYF